MRGISRVTSLKKVRLLLDIGATKTGSKSRQKYFASTYDKRKHSSTVFLETGREGIWHRPVYDRLKAHDYSVLNDLKDEIESLNDECEIALLSFEQFYLLGERQIETLKQEFPDLHVTLFVRRQDEIVSSTLNQLHKAHRVPWSEVEAFEKRIPFYMQEFDYSLHLERWSSRLSKANVKVVMYNKRRSSIETFCEANGIATPPHGAFEDRLNFAIDGFGLAVLRSIKMRVGEDEKLPEIIELAHRALDSHFNSEGPTRYLFPKSSSRKIMKSFKVSNERLRRDWFRRKIRLFPSREHGQYAEHCLDDVGETVVEILSQAGLGH